MVMGALVNEDGIVDLLLVFIMHSLLYKPHDSSTWRKRPEKIT